MNILILGAGILGTTTAWYLNRAGHDVTVIERQPAAGMETSFANGSQISVSYAEPWANPAAPRKIIQWLGREDAPLLFRLRADPWQWLWGLDFLRQCTAARTRFNTVQLIRLGLYSRATLQALRSETGIQYDHLEKGILHLYTSQQEFDEARPGLDLMGEFGCAIRYLSSAEIVTVEPALAHSRQHFAAAAYAIDDESGDAHRFTQQLARLAGERGVQFRYGTHVRRLVGDGNRLQGVVVERAGQIETLSADAYVMCLGSWSAPMLRSVGIRTLIYPAKGYSATLPILETALDTARVSTVSLTDHAMKIVFSRLGNRLRVAGTAELSGYSTDLNPVRCEALTRRAAQFFPGALDTARAEYWTGLRPATPSNIPYIGRSRLDNLWLNTGHGTLGWTHGTGSGRALAELIDGRQPDVDFAFRKA